MVLAKAELLQSDYYCMETFAAWSKACLVLVLVFPLTLVVTYVKPKGGKSQTETRKNLWAQSFGSIFMPLRKEYRQAWATTSRQYRRQRELTPIKSHLTYTFIHIGNSSLY